MNTGNPATVKPAIQRVDSAIYEFCFTRTCDIRLCKGQCCRSGVYMLPAEAARILEHKEAVAAMMDDTQEQNPERWFDEPATPQRLRELEAAGLEIGCATFNHKCVFLDAVGACALQKLAMKEGKHRWAYKPYHCILFPFLVEDGTLTVDREHGDNIKARYNEEFFCDHRGENAVALGIDVCRDELMYALGSDKAYQTLLSPPTEHRDIGTALRIPCPTPGEART